MVQKIRSLSNISAIGCLGVGMTDDPTWREPMFFVGISLPQEAVSGVYSYINSCRKCCIY